MTMAARLVFTDNSGLLKPPAWSTAHPEESV